MQDAAFWKQRDEDKYNAPFPDELGVDSEKKMLGILDKYDQQYKARDANVAVINGWLAAELIKEVFNVNIAGEDKRFSPHYQAVNLEHFAEDEKAAQRVEVRRVPAQIDRATLLKELDRLFALMNRTVILKDPRFAGRSSPTATWPASSSSGGDSSKGSASSGPRPVVLGANDLAPAQGPVLTANRLVHVPILGDGNCFFNAVIRTAGLQVTVADLRKELADAVKDAVARTSLRRGSRSSRPSRPRASSPTCEPTGPTPTSRAPSTRTSLRPTLKLRIIQGDGRIDDVGKGAATVWLVRTSHSVDHYLATRPSG